MDNSFVLKTGEKKDKKLTRELSNREKRLLKLLILFAVFVFFGYYGVLPASKVFRDNKNKLESVKYVQNEYNRKSLRLNSLVSYKERLAEELTEASEGFYPMMQSYEVDRLITGIALDGGFDIQSLSVSPEAAPASLQMYQYSTDVFEPSDFDMINQTFTVETAEEEAARNQFDLSSEIKDKVLDFSATITENMGTDYSGLLNQLDGEEEEETGPTFEGVYVNNVSLLATCSMSEYEKLVDKIYEEYPSIRIVDYAFQPNANEGEFIIDLEVYMAG